MDMNQVLAAELNVKPWQVEAAVKLIDEGNTIPFISRYRKEATGSLNDEILRNLYDRLMYLRSLNDRKAVVLASIEEQGKLTAELKKSIEEAATLVVVEDLYRPYRPKRRTRATIAKEKGLEPLANIILLQMTKEPLEKEAEAFVSEEKEVKTAKDAIAGACDIIAESISDEADYRMEIRRRTEAKGLIVSTAKDEKAESVYENYYEFSEPVSKIAGHRVLALNRGEKEKFLALANGENLEATVVARVTDTGRMVMRWNGKKIVDLSREFLNTNGAVKQMRAKVQKGGLSDCFARKNCPETGKKAETSFAERLSECVSDINICSRQGLAERFDHIVISSGSKSQNLVEIRGLRAQHDDRNVVRLTDLLAHLKSVHPRHHDVQKAELNVLLVEDLQSLLCIVCLKYLIPVADQINLHEIRDLLLIVHYQNASLCHFFFLPIQNATENVRLFFSIFIQSCLCISMILYFLS